LVDSTSEASDGDGEDWASMDVMVMLGMLELMLGWYFNSLLITTV